MKEYYSKGGRAVVDAQPVGCGRDARFLEYISNESGVHIVASTGFHKLMFYPENHWIFNWSEEQIAELYQAELTQGMFEPCDDKEPGAQTEIRAGQIKAALDSEGLTERYRKVFGAVASAQKATGAPLMVYTEFHSNPVELADFLEEKGVDLTRVIFCHMDRTVADLSTHIELCKRGITMEYDTVARDKYHNDEREIEIVTTLLKEGFQSQLLMSLDVTRARLRSYGGEVGLCYILENFLAHCKQSGISEEALYDIFHTNPAKCFAVENN